MAALKKETEVWLYCKNLAQSASLPSEAGVDAVIPPFLQHWAVVTKEPDDELYFFHANDTKEGLLVASWGYLVGTTLREEWEECPGFKKKFLGKIAFYKKQGVAFCEALNERKEKYTICMDNCQKFVNEFKKKFCVEAPLPWNAESVIKASGSLFAGSLAIGSMTLSK